MYLLCNFAKAKVQCTALHYYSSFKTIETYESNLDDPIEIPSKIFTTPEKVIFLCMNGDFERNEIAFSDQFIKILSFRNSQSLPTYIIFDFIDWGVTERYADKIKEFFKRFNVDAEKQILVLGNGNLHNILNHPNILTYNWLSLDGYIWLKHKPTKFTSLDLKKRPNLVNLIVSKLTEKKSRTKLVYEFWKQDLLKSSILSINGTLDEFTSQIDDKDFLEEVNQRISPVGGIIKKYNEGFSNWEFGSETSDRTLFNNCRLSAVHETCFCDPDSKQSNFWTTNGSPTEKTFRSIVNKTPFLIFGSPAVYRELKKLGYQTFENIFNLNFGKSKNCQTALEEYVKQVSYFLEINPARLDEIQEICNFNYQHFLQDGSNNYKYYHNRIDTFLGLNNECPTT